jgi:hypothetical protein
MWGPRCKGSHRKGNVPSKKELVKALSNGGVVVSSGLPSGYLCIELGGVVVVGGEPVGC